jgi:hypothetical protein
MGRVVELFPGSAKSLVDVVGKLGALREHTNGRGVVWELSAK